ncbi:hypothetical protein FKP32DRAFT_1567912 [Trametes sanguinea]|nr:hypothetical protein FKP32DRAFT_1567912 [Trametes sanguinea]
MPTGRLHIRPTRGVVNDIRGPRPYASCVYRILGRLADMIDDLMWFLRIIPRQRPATDFGPCDIDHLSDEELLKLLRANPHEKSLSEEAGVELHDENVKRWSEGTVLKMSYAPGEDEDVPEALAMNIVFHHTLIPVPRVRRVLQDPKNPWNGCIWMDYIRAHQLKFVWPTLSIFGKLRIAFVLCRYIRQLRAIRHPCSAVPGPLGSGLEGRKGYCPLYGELVDTRGPFSSYAEFSTFWNDRHAMSHRLRRRAMPEAANSVAREPFDDSEPLVLTHNDLNFRNILIGDDGCVWLIDWAFSGFYPPWFEFVSTRIQQRDGSDWGDWVWELCIPFICGPYYKQEFWWGCMRGSLNYR